MIGGRGRPPKAAECGEVFRVTQRDGQVVVVVCQRQEGHRHDHAGRLTWPSRRTPEAVT